jgi:hypothetical protein
MAYLQTSLGEWKAGPDYSRGVGLDLRYEEWSYAWGPFVEGRVLELAAEASTIAEAVDAAFRSEMASLQESEHARSSVAWTDFFLRASVLGLEGRLTDVADRVQCVIDDDPSFASVSLAAWRSALLWRSRDVIGEVAGWRALAISTRSFARAIDLALELSGLDEKGEDEAVGHLLSLRETASILIVGERAARAGDSWRGLMQALRSRDELPALAGAATSISYLEGILGEDELGRTVALHFGPGSEAADALRFLVGIVAAAPELPARLPALVESLNDLMLSWDESEFEERLPDLRRAFSGLAPGQTWDFAKEVRMLNGGSGEEDVRETAEVGEKELALCVAVNRILAASLEKEGLMGLIAGGEER